LAIAHYLLTRSHKLILISRTRAALDKLHAQYGAEQVSILAGDMSDPSLAAKAVEVAKSQWGRLDSLIINHGSLDPVKKVGESSAEEWRKAFDVNVFSAVGLVCKVVIFMFSFVMYKLFSFFLSFSRPTARLKPNQNH